MGSSPEILLPGSANQKIPLLGFGTAVYPLAESETIRQFIFHAIKLGYRHFDTVALYRSEEALGQALTEAVRLGLIGSRSDLFITSKLWCSDAHQGLVIPALKNTLKNIGVDYLDLYLIHFPVSLKPGEYEMSMKKEDLLPMDLKLVWEEMEECKELGLTKSIGVSNFSCKKLERLLTAAKIPPAVNQVEMNPVWQQKKLRDFCKAKGIHVTAYSPLGAKGTLWGTNRVMECEVLHQIAKSKGKSIAQICLRWVYEQEVSLVVKSFNKERMEENLHIFDWELSMEELEMISQIPQRKALLCLDLISDNGPYKSLDDLWDGEFASSISPLIMQFVNNHFHGLYLNPSLLLCVCLFPSSFGNRESLCFEKIW